MGAPSSGAAAEARTASTKPKPRTAQSPTLVTRLRSRHDRVAPGWMAVVGSDLPSDVGVLVLHQGVSICNETLVSSTSRGIGGDAQATHEGSDLGFERRYVGPLEYGADLKVQMSESRLTDEEVEMSVVA